jgi:hypothetical protein
MRTARMARSSSVPASALEDESLVCVGRQPDHLDGGAGSQELLGGFDSIQAWHGDVHADHMHIHLTNQPQYVLATTGLGHDLDAWFHIEHKAQRIAYQLMIVGEQYP